MESGKVGERGSAADEPLYISILHLKPCSSVEEPAARRTAKGLTIREPAIGRLGELPRTDACGRGGLLFRLSSGGPFAASDDAKRATHASDGTKSGAQGSTRETSALSRGAKGKGETWKIRRRESWAVKT